MITYKNLLRLVNSISHSENGVMGRVSQNLGMYVEIKLMAPKIFLMDGNYKLTGDFVTGPMIFRGYLTSDPNKPNNYYFCFYHAPVMVELLLEDYGIDWAIV